MPGRCGQILCWVRSGMSERATGHSILVHTSSLAALRSWAVDPCHERIGLPFSSRDWFFSGYCELVSGRYDNGLDSRSASSKRRSYGSFPIGQGLAGTHSGCFGFWALSTRYRDHAIGIQAALSICREHSQQETEQLNSQERSFLRSETPCNQLLGCRWADRDPMTTGPNYSLQSHLGRCDCWRLSMIPLQ